MEHIEQYNFSFREVGIDPQKILYLMGYEQGKAPEPFPELLDKLMDVAGQECAIKGGFSFSDEITVDKKAGTVTVSEKEFETESIVTSRLLKADSAALFICTAGPRISKHIQRCMNQNDLIKGYMLDVIGSEVVESAMDKMQDDLAAKLKAQGLYITNRYSPGYCGWKVEEQKKLFGFFPKDFCGVQLSESSLMHPMKSVSGIIGIGKDVTFNEYDCKACDSVDCIYRNRQEPMTA